VRNPIYAGTIGADLHEPAPEELAEQARVTRIKAARANPRWREVDRELLVFRPRRYLVDARLDVAYVPHDGAVFGADGHIVFDSERDLAFFIEDDDVVVLEPCRESWTTLYGRQAAADARRQ
jgi:hypothetical protein